MWCKLQDIVEFIGGYAYKSNTYVSTSNYQVVRIGNVKNDFLNLENQPVFVPEIIGSHTDKYRIHENDILFTMTGTKGKRDYFFTTIVKKQERILLLNQRVGCLRAFSTELDMNYLSLLLKGNYILDSIFATETGNVSQGNIGSENTLKLLVALPPYVEQQRIVEKVKNFFDILSIIEEREISLQDVIQYTKSKILDLAIHGKLVPQNPNDEPASELLKRINPKAEITCDNPQYGKLPKGWCKTTLKSLAKEVFAGGDKPTEFTKEKTNGNIIPIYANGVEKDGLYGYTNAARVIEPCLTVSARGTIGFTCIRNIPFVPIVRLITIVPNPAFDLKYMKFCLDCLLIWSEGSSIPQLTVPTIKKMQLPLPPLQEQHRIVAKIEELFNQLDKIEESVS